MSGHPSESSRTGGAFRHFLRDPKGAIAGSLFHSRMIPTLIEFSRGSKRQDVAPEALLEDLLGRSIPAETLRSEYEGVRALLNERYERTLHFAAATQLSDPQSFLLYALVRELRPKTVLETGVANGHSTVVLLHALQQNGEGELWSVDISHQVGALVADSERANWKLRILPVRSEREAFRRLLAEIGPIDLFEHDSDHSFEWQKFELEAVWPQLRPGGVLSVDDADWSWATLDFARHRQLPLRTLVTTTRVCGVLRHP